MKKTCIIITLLINGWIWAQHQTHHTPRFHGPYLGQDPPGMQAQIFAPELFHGDQHAGCSGFLEDSRVFIFSSMKEGTDWRFKPTYMMELKDGAWTEPRMVPFNKFLPYNFTVGPGGKTVYFTSLKSPDKSTHQLLEQANIWAVSLHKNGWGEPVMLGESINTTKYYENYPTVASNGTIYYMSHRPGGIGRTDVYKSRNLDGKYAEAENLGMRINTEGSDQDPFISPDEGYLIICQQTPQGYGKYDLYISFKMPDGSWCETINMGPEINSEQYEFRPYVTQDGKYLFFTSNRHHPKAKNGGIFWSDAGIIEKLRKSHHDE